MTDLLLSTVIQTLVDWDTQIFLAINGLHNDYWDNFMQMFSGRFIWLPFYLSIALHRLNKCHIFLSFDLFVTLSPIGR